MIPVHASVLPILLDAVEQETLRLTGIQAAVGDDWPEGFDANDIPLYMSGVEAIGGAIPSQASEIDLAGKALWFLLGLIPNYVQTNRERLSPNELEALSNAYSHQATWIKVPFPN
jgi:hypothetical protein